MTSLNYWVIAALLCYAAAIAFAVADAMAGRVSSRGLLVSLACGVLLLGAYIAKRWIEANGPFYTLFEVLLSNVFSLGTISLLFYWLMPNTRVGALVTLPLLFLLGLWALRVSTATGPQPATYASAWLWAHVGVGKLFLGLLLTATGTAVAAMFSRALIPVSISIEQIDGVSWRLLALAFVFHSLMLISGAVWAQDAWGRFWAWDSLETWSLVTWLAIAATLHLRLASRIRPAVARCCVLVIFTLAFLTFFGLPFTAIAPHRGIL